MRCSGTWPVKRRSLRFGLQGSTPTAMATPTPTPSASARLPPPRPGLAGLGHLRALFPAIPSRNIDRPPMISACVPNGLRPRPLPTATRRPSLFICLDLPAHRPPASRVAMGRGLGQPATPTPALRRAKVQISSAPAPGSAIHVRLSSCGAAGSRTASTPHIGSHVASHPIASHRIPSHPAVDLRRQCTPFPSDHFLEMPCILFVIIAVPYLALAKPPSASDSAFHASCNPSVGVLPHWAYWNAQHLCFSMLHAAPWACVEPSWR